jgi:hypothetical protein
MQQSTTTVRNGHPKFYEILAKLADLHSAKNGDYAGGGRPLGNFERVSALLKMYPGYPLDTTYGVALVYALKQLDAALWLMATGRRGKVEGVPERLQDIAVYAMLAMVMYDEEIERNTQPVFIEPPVIEHERRVQYEPPPTTGIMRFTEGDKQPKPAPARMGGDVPDDLNFDEAPRTQRSRAEGDKQPKPAPARLGGDMPDDLCFDKAPSTYKSAVARLHELMTK